MRECIISDMSRSPSTELSTEVFEVTTGQKRALIALRGILLLTGFFITKLILWPVLAGNFLIAWIGAGVFAAVCLMIEMIITAKVMHTTLEKLGTYRLLYLDWLLAGKDAVVLKQPEVPEDFTRPSAGKQEDAEDNPNVALSEDYDSGEFLRDEPADLDEADSEEEIVIDADVVE